MNPLDDAPAVRFLLDASVWARIPVAAEVRSRLVELRRLGQFALATPTALEIGFSARSLREWDDRAAAMRPLEVLPMSPRTHGIALDIQRALWGGGLVRAAGAFDVMVAAVAIEHAAVVVHYDRDFEHIAAAVPDFRQEWAVPAGTID